MKVTRQREKQADAEARAAETEGLIVLRDEGGMV